MLKILRLMFLAATLCQSAIAAETADDVLSNSISHSALAPMPEQWFSCDASNDCTWVGYDCDGDGYAVNVQHIEDAYGVFCLTNHLCSACKKSAPPNSKAVCEAGHCVTEPLSSKHL
jgi:hypothetical protein